jgi:hypothetical protein
MNQAKKMEISPGIENGPEQPQGSSQHAVRLVLAVVVPFLDEREHLPAFLASIDRQTRRPDELVLVDDGSTDGSFEIAKTFSDQHSYATAVRRPPRPPEFDRLATAAELRAFQWGSEQIKLAYDIVAKRDADLELSPVHFADIVEVFERNPSLGLAGAYLSIRSATGSTLREKHPPDHVRGPNKFYRRECLDQISPLPPHLGWDTIDEVKARMSGWRVASIELSKGDSIHLRPTGAHDGRLRAFKRWGECAYGFGSHPLNVLAGGVARIPRRPYVLGGAAYVTGWVLALIRRRPQADREVRAFKQREELRRIRGLAAPHRTR